MSPVACQYREVPFRKHFLLKIAVVADAGLKVFYIVLTITDGDSWN